MRKVLGILACLACSHSWSADCARVVSTEAIFDRFSALALVRPFFETDSYAEWEPDQSNYLLVTNFTLADETRGHFRCRLYYNDATNDFTRVDCMVRPGHYPNPANSRVGATFRIPELDRQFRVLDIKNVLLSRALSGQVIEVESEGELYDVLRDLFVAVESLQE